MRTLLIPVKNFLYRLWNDQRTICLVFIAGMMVPNLFLAVTEPYTWAAIGSSLLMAAGFYLLWAILLPRPGGMILAALPLMVIGAFQFVVLYLFGGSIIAVDMFTNLFTTNASEATELIGNIWPAILGICVLYIPLLILGGRSLVLPRMSGRLRGRMALWAAGLILGGGIFAGIARSLDPAFGIRYQVFPADVAYNLKLTLDRWKMRNAYYETSRDFAFHTLKTARAGQREIYVLIVGEAARADAWSLFGCERETTPRLRQRDGLVAFGRVTTQCNTTHKSVPLMLSPVSAANYPDAYKQKSIIAAFKEAGFRTAYISNQVPNRSLIDFYAAEADERIDISPRESELTTVTRYDGDMIPRLQEVMAKDDRNLFVVLHMYGSHFDYAKRYPETFAQFQPAVHKSVDYRYRQEMRNSYDNSILYTDYVIDGIIAALDSARVCSALLYCSDHGEDLMDDTRKRFLHASPTPTYYQLHVAALAWFSPAYREFAPKHCSNAARNCEKILTTANVFHTIADMAFLTGTAMNSRESAVNDDFTEQQRLYLNDHNLGVTLEACGLEKLDFEMFRQQRIALEPPLPKGNATGILSGK